ncbi:MFS transporter [Ignatzschineria ureiclastica]|uniref:MFS transporter n=1 Tax=Ignatzschineria ureiclastica TaxID=472582 RepID=A0A2U2AD23_9GAMM|nr:MFS transporter [Ignatzschineria ureiclastica]PWD80517.1 MFS transporter [Ignatzschineria ureiclastica]GGZ98869.1 MFS transporter [Ignatzschineria ureiclastica]
MHLKWKILALIILIYLPVSIDATVLHVALPTLGLTLSATATELLWIIDIYSLMMAGLLLPMGVLGDRMGYKKLAILGLIIFGFSSLFAALSTSPMMLIVARAFLAVGAAMILPATLSGVRSTFTDDAERAMALGLWTTIGVAGAAIGPLVGGYLLQYFYWGSVFLINIPIVIIAIIGILWIVPAQKENPAQQWQIGKALLLIIGILMTIYALKSFIKMDGNLLLPITLGVLGIALLIYFVRRELQLENPMFDFGLLKERTLAIGVIIAITAMISMVGFEFVMAQELQFVYGFTPLKAGLFMLPLMLASGLGGPIAGWLVARFGLRAVATIGIGISAISFFGLAFTNIMTQTYLVWGFLILLGLSIGIALLASTTAIMSAAPPEKSASAGAIEGMAYELGAGFGVVFFGMFLTLIFSHHIMVPADLLPEQAQMASSSINQAFLVAEQLSNQEAAQRLVETARESFVFAHFFLLLLSGILLSLLTVIVWRFLPKRMITSGSISH